LHQLNPLCITLCHHFSQPKFDEVIDEPFIFKLIKAMVACQTKIGQPLTAIKIINLMPDYFDHYMLLV
jgi:hypothetical protein